MHENNSPIAFAVPTDVFPQLDNVRALPTSGAPHCLARADGRAVCYGDNRFGEVGSGTTERAPQPIEVVGLADVAELTVGDFFSACARTYGGEVYCWGQGPLGDGTEANALAPIQVLGIASAAQISASWTHKCVVLGDGAVMCWGDNLAGECGQPASFSILEPVPVGGLPAVTQVATGFDVSCALTVDGDVYCWGSNNYCKLGMGSLEPTATHVPQRVIFADPLE
jgi:alpha-tubulin suppressor-like RCC1 family protein